jgi:hypothetical protein
MEPVQEASTLFAHELIVVKGACRMVKRSAEFSVTSSLKTPQISRLDLVSRSRLG